VVPTLFTDAPLRKTVTCFISDLTFFSFSCEKRKKGRRKISDEKKMFFILMVFVFVVLDMMQSCCLFHILSFLY
jgi:hypothetical protein